MAMLVGGRDIAVEDVLATVYESHPAISRGGGTAFTVRENDAELVVVVVEIERRSGGRRRTVEVAPLDALEAFWYEPRLGDRRRGPPQGVPHLEDQAIGSAIVSAVSAGHAIKVQVTILVPIGSLPRGADGRIDRDACRAALFDGRAPS